MKTRRSVDTDTVEMGWMALAMVAVLLAAFLLAGVARLAS